jgi:hypothetical protein
MELEVCDIGYRMSDTLSSFEADVLNWWVIAEANIQTLSFRHPTLCDVIYPFLPAHFPSQFIYSPPSTLSHVLLSTTLDLLSSKIPTPTVPPSSSKNAFYSRAADKKPPDVRNPLL